MDSSEESMKEMNFSLLSAESEFNKKLALLEQEIEFLNSSLSEYSKKEKSLNEEMDIQKKQYLEVVKSGSSRFEDQILVLTVENEKLAESLNSSEKLSEEFEAKYELQLSLKQEYEEKLDRQGDISVEGMEEMKLEIQ